MEKASPAAGGSSMWQKGEAGRPEVPREEAEKGEAGREAEMKEERERRDPQRLPAIYH
jgi:hypothetical protein